jgi:murein biosynthesis integral membrane protein MurJ
VTATRDELGGRLGPTDVESLARPAGAAGDSMAVAAWTIVSRVTGVGRVAAIAAVLGPTYFGNAFQITNALPNLVYYGLLGGSLFCSLLVPAMVRHIDAGDRLSSERVAGGFFGLALLGLLAVTPIALVLGPLVLKAAAVDPAGGSIPAAQERVGRWLVVMFMPQVFLYAVVATSVAIMNARRRFALAAAAPALENVGIVAVLGVTAALYGTGTPLGRVGTGEVLLLGLGTTGAVALHAAVQWYGARRAGVVLRPYPGWRFPEVRALVRRAIPSLGQAGLLALQLLTLLVLANRIAGGAVAMQIALNFYALPIAVGATPVALALLPRLSRITGRGEQGLFHDTVTRGFVFAVFLVTPVALAYAILAEPLAHTVAYGRMGSTAGVALVAAPLAALAPGVLGETAFLVATYACYARKDTRTPLRSMTIQAAVTLTLASLALRLHGTAVLVMLGLAFSAGSLLGAWHLWAHVRRTARAGTARLWPSLARIAVAAALTAIPTSAIAMLGARMGHGRVASLATIVAAVVLGAATFVGIQALWRAPELTWVAGGLGQLRGKAHAALDRLCSVPRFLTSVALCVAAVAGAAVAGGLAVVATRWVVLGLVAAAVITLIYARPAFAAYLVVGGTPLVVGIDRGVALPVLRPNEALALLAALGLLLRGVRNIYRGQASRPRLGAVEITMVLMAVANSVVELLWMGVRRHAITGDDLLYALVMWKFIGVYAIVRTSVRTERQVRRCLWVSLTSGAVVGAIAILQALNLFGVPRLLATYYTPEASARAVSAQSLTNGRGSSTLSLPAAVADLMVLNLAIAIGLAVRGRKYRVRLVLGALLFAFGALSAGEFSSAIGLVVGLLAVVAVTGRLGPLLAAVPAGAGASVLLRPIIQRRLSGFQSASGIPISWTGRLANLRGYFWPELFSHDNYLLGVRTSARVPGPAWLGTPWVWIESGYTWLLWAGGIPLLGSYVAFVVTAVRRSWRTARRRHDAVGVAAIATLAGVCSVVVLMAFDPHLTYRGSADALFGLVALSRPQIRPRVRRAHAAARRGGHGCLSSYGQPTGTLR